MALVANVRWVTNTKQAAPMAGGAGGVAESQLMMARHDEAFTLNRFAPRSDRNTLTIAGRTVNCNLTMSVTALGKQPIPDAETMREILFADDGAPNASDKGCLFLMPRQKDGANDPNVLLDGWYHPECATRQLREAARTCYATAAMGTKTMEVSPGA